MLTRWHYWLLPLWATRHIVGHAGAFALTKPRIIELLLVTTLPTMVVAKRGLPSIWLMVATVIGGTLAAGGANAINMVVDRDIDRLMNRTKKRPLVTGAMTPGGRVIFASPGSVGVRRVMGDGEPALGRHWRSPPPSSTSSSTPCGSSAVPPRTSSLAAQPVPSRCSSVGPR